jgi:hypothetical protein
MQAKCRGGGSIVTALFFEVVSPGDICHGWKIRTSARREHQRGDTATQSGGGAIPAV